MVVIMLGVSGMKIPSLSSKLQHFNQQMRFLILLGILALIALRIPLQREALVLNEYRHA